MPRVVRYTLKQTVLINVLFVILVVAGVFSLLTTPTENMPLVDMGRVFVHTVYYGASAEDVEQLVTRKIEDALEDLESVEYVQSHSYRNFSSVQVKFLDDTDYRYLYDELRFLVLNIKDELPRGAEEPTFIWLDTDIWKPVIEVHVGGDLSLRGLERYAEELRVQLLAVPDVRDVAIRGSVTEEFHLALDPERLRRFGVTFMEVVRAVESAGTKIPTGRFRTGDTAFMLDTGRRLERRQQVLEVVVRRDGDGNFIRVGDLAASARLHHRDPITIASVNGHSAIRMVVTKERQGNAVTISGQVKTAAQRFGERHADEGISVVFTNDSTIEINDALRTLGGNLLLGMALVILVLWLTLGFRNAMITAVGIPFSFLCALAIMKFTGLTINTISLFSFVLVTGIIVDDAVIIVENTFRHMQMGKNRRQAIIDGTAEVMLPVISAALTTLLAFLPMLIMTGHIGDFFAIIPKTVAFALIASLLEALFILPIHVWDWGPRQPSTARQINDKATPFAHLQSGVFGLVWRVYRRLLLWVLDHKLPALLGMNLLLAAAVAILLLSMLGIAPLIQVKFFPGNYFRYHVTLQTAAGTSLERTDEMVRETSRFILSLGPGQAESAAGMAGYYEDQDYVRHNGPNYGQVVVTLPEVRQRDFPGIPGNDPIRYLPEVRRKIADHVAATYGDDPANPRVQVFEEVDGPPTGKAVNVRIQGPAMEEALAAADHLLARMRDDAALSDLVDLGDDRPSQHRTVRFEPRQEAVYEYNLSVDRVTALVAGVLNGWYAGVYRTIDEEVDMVVRLARHDDPVGGANGLATPLDALAVPVIDHSAAPIYLRDLVNARYAREPNVRSRYQGRPTVTVSADIRAGANLSAAAARNRIQAHWQSAADTMPGVVLTFGGEFESTLKSYTSLATAFAIAILGIYMVLSSQFRDYLQPLIILAAVPFSLIGVSFGIFFTRGIFTIASFIATVGLSGVAVNNTILLLDFMNKRYRDGKDLRPAILESCAARMRPVLITTVTTLLGLLPMAIGIPSKSLTWAPMATAFVTGLSSATVLALLITPVNYELLEGWRAKLRRRRIGKLRRKGAF
ncbi:efflux RND transporter permease subunit [Desulfatitalea alkaliphila]|uniref:Efflux RND transporter permease subunit n=1 Tax=Desulfatitalea alkaliphila TaxID=2929485 RepID=A0AA41R220_9BACT|nr:efflux RND transporter permease subunit [Desulfatitalea alkaliphila]MCJ8499400.1 efflux RND transporter permease subunit [Desulfatitalea alkaliphila]